MITAEHMQILDHNGRPIPSVSPGVFPVQMETLQKGWKQLPNSGADHQPKTLAYDPMTLMYTMGYKDRRFALSYEVIRQVTKQLSLSAAIIRHRINQCIQFCSPYRYTHNSTGLGFQIKHKNADRTMSASEKRFAAELEQFIMFCGNPKANKHTGKMRPDFETFTKMFLRDLMEIDQGCFEIVPTRSKVPFEFMAVDGATIRIAANEYAKDRKQDINARNEAISALYNPIGKKANWPQYDARGGSTKLNNTSHVQVIRGQIQTLYQEGEMGFCIQNPRTDLLTNGYGESNTELLIRIITAHLYAEQHNMNVFQQGSFPKGILNIAGEDVDPAMLEAFKRQWAAQIQGVENSWKTPVFSGPEIQFIPFQNTNQEMEFNNWINYLIRLQCAVWSIDPAEVGFELQSSQGQFAPPQYESPQEWKIKKSKDRGLRPLLRYYAYILSKEVIDKIDDHFYLDFVGLDELDQKDQIELLQQEATVFKTLNEVREAQGLEPLEDGDVILNPTYLQWKQMQQNQAMMEQQQQMAAEGQPADGQAAPAAQAAPAEPAKKQEKPAADKGGKEKTTSSAAGKSKK